MPPRPGRRQYADVESGNGNTNDQDQLMRINTETAYTGAHGVPTYTPYNSEQITTHPMPSDSKNIELEAYPLSGTADGPNFPPFEPKENFVPSKSKSSKRPFRDRHRMLVKLIQSLTLFLGVGFLLAIPLMVTSDAIDTDEDSPRTRQKMNMVFWIFVMFESTWAGTGVFYAFALVLPYIYRLAARFINPAWERYWRAFIILRKPIVLLFTVIMAFISLALCLTLNERMVIPVSGSTEEEIQAAAETIASVINTITEVLVYLILWAGGYLVEKVLVMYLTIHYHHRSNHPEILRSKKFVDSLAALYDYSYSMYPNGHAYFQAEDYIIHNARQSSDGHKTARASTFGTMDRVTGNFAHGFGIIFGSESTSHWFAPQSTYALINRALQHPESSAALAKRIWLTLVSENSDVLTAKDIKDALGPSRETEAAAHFAILDENENGDIKLSEMVPSIVDGGKRRKDIYMNMADMVHVISSLHYILCGLLAAIMLFLVLISEVPLLANLKEVIGFSALGISVVVGRTLNEFVQGAIFTILDHPYDVGETVEMFTMSEKCKTVLVVKKISLLYTIFEEPGSMKQVQYGNMRSKFKRIANLSRSEKNREAIVFGVDFATSFKDLQLFKSEIQSFITAPENKREYYPEVALRVTDICDLQRMELKVSIRHKSNWSNDPLRQNRSSRLHCAIVDAARRVPINKPGWQKTLLGEEGRPTYQVMITDDEVPGKRAAEIERLAKKRMDYVKAEAVADVDTSGLSEEEKAAMQEQKKKAAEEAKAAKEAIERQEEAAARIKLMGIKLDGLPERYTSSSSGIELDDEGQSRFRFISGQERGLRRQCQ